MRAQASADDDRSVSFPGHFAGIFREQEALRRYDPAKSGDAHQASVQMSGQDQVGAPAKISVHIGGIMGQKDPERPSGRILLPAEAVRDSFRGNGCFPEFSVCPDRKLQP